MSLNFWSDKKPGNEESEVRVEVSPTPEEDIFWMQFGKDSVKDTIEVLDERAKYMITTCASLIVIHFGLLLAFKVQGISFKVSPEFFLVVASALFAVSLYPIAGHIEMQSPDSVKSAYDTWIKWKLWGHRIGFGFFIAGLLAMTITIIIPQPPLQEKSMQTTNGTLSLSINGTGSRAENITTHPPSTNTLLHVHGSFFNENNTMTNTGNNTSRAIVAQKL